MSAVASIPTNSSRKFEVSSAGYSRPDTLSICLALAKLGGTQIVVCDDGIDFHENGSFDVDWCHSRILPYVDRGIRC